MHRSTTAEPAKVLVEHVEPGVGPVSRMLRRHPALINWILVAPAALWELLVVGIPMVSILLFSFWQSGFGGLQPNFTLQNYSSVLGSATFWRIIVWTYAVVLIVLVGVIILAYPAAYAIWRCVKDERIKTLLLLLCIIPFWTSYLTRTITWLPMFGREGLVNRALISLGVIREPLDILLYSPYAMIAALWALFIVFMIGPLYWSMNRIDEDILDAAAVLGAKPIAAFLHVILPLTRPGLMAGVLFTTILGLAEFFTERVIGGGQHPMLAGLILREIDVFQWAGASAIAVILVVSTLVTVIALLRWFDIRKV